MTTGDGGKFFAIDRRTWGAVCDRGEMNPAVAYLVLAQGTGRSNRTTIWSVTSLKSSVGIDWERGKRAIQKLVDEGFIRHGEKHTPQRPRYELATWPEVLERKRANLSEYDRLLMTDICDGRQPSRSSRKRLDEMAAEGLLVKVGGCYSVTAPTRDGNAKDDPIWLPNSLVVGTDRGEESPVRRLRGSGNLWTLRLLVDLYHVQNLRADGGISPHVLRYKYERRQVGERGVFTAWAFMPERKSLSWTGPFEPHYYRQAEKDNHPVWENVEQLERQGLLTFVPHLWESEQQDAEPIHAYGIEDIGGEPLEVEIGKAAHEAALTVGLGPKIDTAAAAGYRYLAPVKNTLPNVQMIGVARLRYRPHTKRTEHWWQELNESAETWLAAYRQLHVPAEQPRKVSNGNLAENTNEDIAF